VNDTPYTYKQAGVDIEAADRVKGALGELVASTRTGAVRGGYGSFGGRFSAEGDDDLVASADGVGTKLVIAFRTGRHDTVGEDLVNHCVNDILTEGARPLVFMDYFATGRLEPDVTVQVVEGVARGCRANGCALLGGETAEMPGFYGDGEYDLAGFVVGQVAWPEVARRDVLAGDVLVALPSSGFHTNGYSFLRGLLFDRLGYDVDTEWPGLDQTVGDVLLRVHLSYLPVLGEVGMAGVRALAHVTGGGIPGNLSRVLPATLDAVVDTTSWEPGPEFRFVAEASAAAPEELYRTLNMGIGMLAMARAEDGDRLVASLHGVGCAAFICGEVVAGEGTVRLAGVS
jgi:phosphoribosylformylglycinamidine cyclo-ligase